MRAEEHPQRRLGGIDDAQDGRFGVAPAQQPADADDVLLAAAASVWSTAGQPDWRQRSGRLLRLVLDGLRYRPNG
ncbi:hypothetical protein [Inquilinus sp. OTU3971]|uniref:hypothetical protein n=1 Tax=Inquilinus sp. OTU3971 TaxID=3043855 RepID=UPI00313E3145